MMPTRWVLASEEDICVCRKACSSCPKCRWLPVMAPSAPLAHTTSSLNSSKTYTVNTQTRYSQRKAGAHVWDWVGDDMRCTVNRPALIERLSTLHVARWRDFISQVYVMWYMSLHVSRT